ncbi:hypothetical protein L7F22_013102 [Adiantum nelumboides]|nr:hypothetical protein [Adiantum nelumboides]
MTIFLQVKGYWDYIEGENDEAPRCLEENGTPEEKKALKDWKQGKMNPLLKAISNLSSKPSIQIEAAEVEVVAQVVVATVNIKIGSKTRIKVVEEEDKIIETRGEVEIKMLAEIKTMHLMLNVGHVVSGVAAQMNVQQHKGDQITEHMVNAMTGLSQRDREDQSLDEEFGIPAVKTPVPTCFEDVIGNENWEIAMDEEMVALGVNQTWELVQLPEGKEAIGCKWVYKVKHKVDGTIEKFKARLVAKGYAQTYGIDYEETFALVAKMARVCTVIAVATVKGWFMHQMDVKNAFLQWELQEKVYVEQPPGYEDDKHPDYVSRL